MSTPYLYQLSSNRIFAPQTKLHIAEGTHTLGTDASSTDIPIDDDENLGLREISKDYGNFSTSNFTRLIRDLTKYLPDNIEYVLYFVYDYTEMGIREYEKIEIIEETEQEGDLTTDIDNIFAETFQEEIDDIFADTF